MRKSGVIILGSSNSHGNTYKAAKYVKEHTGYDLIVLKTKEIGEFDYNFENKNDDFLPLMSSIVDNYTNIVFATPVYWYTMSGIMKTFFDRISDCLKTEKDMGRKLRGKNMAVISSASDHVLVNGFEMPFVESARYLGMHYIDIVHTWVEDDVLPNHVKQALEKFAHKLIEL